MNMNKLVTSLFLIQFLLLSSHSFGQFQVVFNVPNNNSVLALETNGDLVFAGTGGSGIFRSTDNGTTWTEVNNGIQPWYYFSLLSLNDTLFAGSFGFVHQSFDNGDSWIDMNIGLDLNDNINALKRKGPFLYSGVSGKGVYATLLGSGTWSSSNSGFHANPTVNDLLVVGSDIYAATDAGVYKSADDAANWVLKDNGLSSILQVYSVFHSSDFLFAGTSDGLFKSADGGETWVASNSGLPLGSNVESITEMNGSIFLGTFNGLYASADLGDTWLEINNGSTGFGFISSVGASNSYLFIGKGGAIYSNGGAPVSTDDLGNYTPDQIVIYPNPGKDEIYIQKDELVLTEIQIMDADGRLVKTINQITNTLPITDLAKGIYFIKLVSDENTIIKKFVKR